METRAHFAIVGAFVILALVAIAAFSVWLGRAALDRRIDRYEVVFTGAVSGLQVGSAVHYRGIPVGRVASLRINPDNVGEILTEIDLQAGTPVKTDTYASLEAQGITGLSIIQLEGGTQASPLLAATGQDLPRIPSVPGALQRLVQSTPELLARGVILVDRAASLLSDANLQAVGQSLQNLSKVTGVLAARGETIDQTLGDVRATAADLRVAAAAIATLSGEAQDVLKTANGAFATVGEQGKTTLIQLGRAGASLSRASDRLDSFLVDTTEPIQDFSRTGLYQVTDLIVGLRDLTSTLTRISRQFERDPSGFLLGGTRRGVPAQ